MARIGVDVGNEYRPRAGMCEGVFYHKVPTTLKNQSIGVVDGVQGICRKAGIAPPRWRPSCMAPPRPPISPLNIMVPNAE
ncbi:hypothetical protein ACFSHQ_26805 [Gemmobacter lanyuensis]